MDLANGFPLDLATVTIVIQLIFLEGILSIDNAAVLGAMVSVLPDNKPVPYPRGLHVLQGFTDHYLGMQRSAALKVGLLGAYVGRGLMLFLASHVIENPWLRIVGAAYLIKLVLDHLPQYARPNSEHAAETAAVAVTATGFWMVVVQVELADLAFSLDNVVAAVALSQEFWVVMLGVALGIVTMRFAAGIFTHLIEREPILAPAAYLVVLNIAVELILEDFHLVDFHEWTKFVISVGTLVLAVIYAHSPPLQRAFGPLLHLIARGMTAINDGLNWLLRPLSRLFHALARSLTTLVRRMTSSRSSLGTTDPASSSPDSDRSAGSVAPKDDDSPAGSKTPAG